MKTPIKSVTIKAAIITAFAIIVASLIPIFLNHQNKETKQQNITLESSPNSNVYQANDDINIVQPQLSNDAAKRNFFRLFQKDLNVIKYSFRVIEDIPHEYNKHLDYKQLSPYKRPFNLRRFKLNNESNYYFFHPLDPEDGQCRNKVEYFIIEDLSVQKSELYKIFLKPSEVDLFFDLLVNCGAALQRLKKFWDSTLEGNAEKSPNWDLQQITPNDIELATSRSIHAKHFLNKVHTIESLVRRLNKKFGYSMRFDLSKEYPDINIAIVYLDKK